MADIVKDIDPVIQYAFYDELIYKAYPEYVNLSFEEIHRKVGNVRPERLLEVAIAKQGGLTPYNTKGMDYTDLSDAKSASVRTSGNGKRYSAPIAGIAHKRGLLRTMVFERKLNKFYYFLIPYEAYKDIPEKSNIEIYFNLDGTPKRNASVRTYTNMWAYEVADFNGILSKDAPSKWMLEKMSNCPSNLNTLIHKMFLENSETFKDAGMHTYDEVKRYVLEGMDYDSWSYKCWYYTLSKEHIVTQ